MKTLRIAIIGECMIELSKHNGHIDQRFGGDTSNTAIYLARLLDPAVAEVSYVTGVGEDSFSDAMIDIWVGEGIVTDKVVRLADRLPGLYCIETTPDGERSFSYWRSESAAKYWLDTPCGQNVVQALADTDLLYVSGISLAILNTHQRECLFELFRICRSRGGRVIFDNNYRPRLWSEREEAQQVYARMCSMTDIALLTLDDEEALWGDQSIDTLKQRYRGLGIAEIIIRRGADTCLALVGNDELEVAAINVPPEQIKDTTAAGDSFSAGYLACRLQGGDVSDAIHHGHLLASRVIQYPGAIIPMDAMP